MRINSKYHFLILVLLVSLSLNVADAQVIFEDHFTDGTAAKWEPSLGQWAVINQEYVGESESSASVPQCCRCDTCSYRCWHYAPSCGQPAQQQLEYLVSYQLMLWLNRTHNVLLCERLWHIWLWQERTKSITSESKGTAFRRS